MEYEVRFYYSKKALDKINAKLNKINNLKQSSRLYEKTTQYDHSCDSMSFYSKDIDGRFRIRISKNSETAKCKVSWKRRLPSTIETDVNKEEEYELTINPDEYNNLIFIVDNVLKMKSIESYERYRTIYYNEEIKISVDEYPFGIALEIENKSDSDPEETIKKWTAILNLDIKKAYRLSWDDKYLELCNSQNIEVFKHVLFDLPMPEVIE
ncbi:MAG: CYTH domain-containing protein [Bacilli bacterium]|nr:CYTH domain-containing protein [Bacilli bacterium]